MAERVIPQGNHFALAMDHFADCLMNNNDIFTPGEEGLRDMRYVAAIYEAAPSGKTIKL